MYVPRVILALFATSLFSATQSHSGEKDGFESKNICSIKPDGRAEIDRKKLIIHRAKIKWGLKKYISDSDQEIRDFAFKIANKREEESSSLDFFFDGPNRYDGNIFRVIRDPSCGNPDVRKYPVSGPEFLSDKQSSKASEYCIRVMCLTYTPPKTPTQTAENAQKNHRSVKTRACLREDSKNCRVPVTAANAKPAVFSGTNDFLKDEWKANAKLAGGIVFDGYLTKKPGIGPDDSPLLFNPFTFIPFATYERRFSSKAGDEVNKLGSGAYFDVHIGNTDGSGITHTLALQAEFITDDKADTSIGNGQLLYFPSLPLPGFRHLYPVGVNKKLAFFVQPTGIWEYGHVSDAGGNIKLLTTKEYSRAGGEISFILTGNPADGKNLLDQLKFYAEYKWLKGFEGPLDIFRRFTTGVNYTFGKHQNFGFGLKYVDGHADVTLQDQEFVEGTFTVKF